VGMPEGELDFSRKFVLLIRGIIDYLVCRDDVV